MCPSMFVDCPYAAFAYRLTLPLHVYVLNGTASLWHYFDTFTYVYLSFHALRVSVTLVGWGGEREQKTPLLPQPEEAYKHKTASCHITTQKAFQKTTILRRCLWTSTVSNRLTLPQGDTGNSIRMV
jgi:hypothetical protein